MSNIFQKDFIINHKFRVKEIIFSDKTPLYKIDFSSINKKTSYEYAAYGSIYISKQDFAIYKLNYNLYYNRKKDPRYTVTIQYTPKKDKMYLNYITFNNFFEAEENPPGEILHVTCTGYVSPSAGQKIIPKTLT